MTDEKGISEASKPVTELPLSVTRENLLDGTLLARARAAAAAVPLLSDRQLETSLDETLAQHDPEAEVWLFGYGSLMWNPIISYDKELTGLVEGWHRHFCLWSRIIRGTADFPGLALALDRGGSCHGKLFRIPADRVRSELQLIWRREMPGGTYIPLWVDAETVEGPIRAVTFVVDQSHAGYTGILEEAEVIDRLTKATGVLGSCADYLEETVTMLESLGVSDPAIEALWRRVKSARA
ncbi:MAG: gamma-glutamylcyclotransferase [Dongiaceae bacterium]